MPLFIHPDEQAPILAPFHLSPLTKQEIISGNTQTKELLSTSYRAVPCHGHLNPSPGNSALSPSDRHNCLPIPNKHMPDIHLTRHDSTDTYLGKKKEICNCLQNQLSFPSASIPHTKQLRHCKEAVRRSRNPIQSNQPSPIRRRRDDRYPPRPASFPRFVKRKK
jgi:hypothetical protein